MPKRRNTDVESWYKTPEPETCPLCGREIPPSVRDLHHLVPKLKGGKVTQSLHRICHRQIHALFTESELAQYYSTIEALLTYPDMQTFVKWVKSKPNDFMDRTRKSKRLR
ncbi:MAG: HNH endonuclease signature motif containing protein [Limnobacter sp.]|nr:HNH endonuclease signature motif containing protein [Limnobacter sp.]